MYVVESKGAAVVCMLLALFFLGTWPAFLILLERRGRLPQHTYLDYSITNLLAAVIIALTFGEMGKSTPQAPNFFTQLSQLTQNFCTYKVVLWVTVMQDNWTSVMFAMAGGVVLTIGNISTQYAWALVGLSVTQVISTCIGVVIGTTLNYFLDDKINNAKILFPGVACFLLALCFGSAVHASNAADNRAKLTSRFGADVSSVSATSKEAIGDKGCPVSYPPVRKDMEEGSSSTSEVKFGTADFLVELENRRAIKVYGESTMIGLGITFFAGLCFSLFSPAFNLATNDKWHILKEGVPKLVVYTAFFWFSVSGFILAIILNLIFLYRPALNSPSSSVEAYLKDWNGRGWALFAGLLSGFGNGFSFMGGQAAGYAAAAAVQALPLVSTFWDVVLFGEYRRSSRRTYGYLFSMLSLFLIAVVVLMASSGHRK
ncbi:Phospholipid metabolism protein [Turnera subulata]|uniref:Phospholipid metabolism protein n=1 Tax=Turnera subulata TaxID=218843 RepID=A0A9Q0FA74_9ROSI|nr:Phospholipid metabolism protein [Turnera subulata]